MREEDYRSAVTNHLYQIERTLDQLVVTLERVGLQLARIADAKEQNCVWREKES